METANNENITGLAYKTNLVHNLFLVYMWK